MAIYPPPIIIHTGNTWIWVKPILMKTITIIVCFGSLLDKYLVYLTTNLGSASENGACFFILKLEYSIQTHFRKIYSVNSLHSMTIDPTQCALLDVQMTLTSKSCEEAVICFRGYGQRKWTHQCYTSKTEWPSWNDRVVEIDTNPYNLEL